MPADAHYTFYNHEERGEGEVPAIIWRPVGGYFGMNLDSTRPLTPS